MVEQMDKEIEGHELLIAKAIMLSENKGDVQ